MKRIYLFIVLLFPLFGISQTRLSLDECIELAKENNKRISSALFQAESAKFQKREALSYFLPRFSLTGVGLYTTVDGSFSMKGGMLPVLGVNGAPTGESAVFPGINLDYSGGWIYGGGVKMEQALFAGGKIASAYKMSKHGEYIAQQNRRLTESEVVVETARAYAGLVRATQMSKVASAYNELLVELMRSVEKAVKHGAKSRNDLLKVEVKLNESELNMRRVENAQRLAMMNLCHYIGSSLSDKVEVSEDLPTNDYSVSSTADINSRPEIQMLAHKSEVMRLKANIARADMLPQLGLVGMYGYMHGFEVAGKTLLDKWNFSAGVQLSIPIINLGSFSKYRSAQMLHRQAEAEKEDKIELMTLEMTRAANNLDEAALEVSLAKKSVISASENLRVSSSQYRHGVETLSDHLEAQALWQQAEQTLIDTRVNQFLRWIEYRKASGTIN